MADPPGRSGGPVVPAPVQSKVTWAGFSGEVRIKAGPNGPRGYPDNPSKDDLLAGPTATQEEKEAERKSMVWMARYTMGAMVPVANFGAPVVLWGIERNPPMPSPGQCEAALMSVIGIGGANAKDMASYFFRNTNAGGLRVFDGQSFWAGEVRGDTNFKENLRDLTVAITESLQLLARQNNGRVDIARLAENRQVPVAPGMLQPAPLASFGLDIGFSVFSQWRRAAGNPLAFGIGSIQGIEVFITAFKGTPLGDFEGKLRFEMYDHFGSDPGDVRDWGQAALYLLQRRCIDGQDTMRYKPYRVKIIVDDVPFAGSIKPWP